MIVITLCAQVGVGLYMFIVGLGFRKDHFKASAGAWCVLAIMTTLMASPLFEYVYGKKAPV